MLVLVLLLVLVVFLLLVALLLFLLKPQLADLCVLSLLKLFVKLLVFLLKLFVVEAVCCLWSCLLFFGCMWIVCSWLRVGMFELS